MVKTYVSYDEQETHDNMVSNLCNLPIERAPIASEHALNIYKLHVYPFAKHLTSKGLSLAFALRAMKNVIYRK